MFKGNLTVAELKKHGGFGLGTFNNIDGEMIVLEGEVYQVGEDGAARVAPPEAHTPFAVVTTFIPDITVIASGEMDREALETYIHTLLPSRHVIYALKVEGVFDRVQMRSEGPHQRPGTKLADVVRDQVVFERVNIAGTLVGYWFPADAEGIDGVGYHFHFISADRSTGGHVFDYQIVNATLAFAAIDEVSIVSVLEGNSQQETTSTRLF